MNLGRHARHYAFFQAVWLFQRIQQGAVEVGHGGPFADEAMLFRANPSLAFEPSEIDTLETTDAETEVRGKGLMTVNFMGLYGPASPLPTFYTEEIIEAAPDDETGREFLDIFNHRYISFFYRAWEKYRYYIQYRDGGLDRFSSRIFSLLGLGPPILRQGEGIEWQRLLPYAGLLGMRVRSAALITKVISHYFGGIQVRVTEFVAGKTRMDESQWSRLGQANSGLGQGAFLGTQVDDAAGEFMVNIGPVDYETYQKFLAGGEHHKPLRELMSFMLVDRLHYSVRICLETKDITGVRLKRESPDAALGWTAWLGRPKGEIVCANQAGQ